MVTINLLPWRDYTRIYSRAQFKKMLVISLIIVSMLLMSTKFFLAKQEQELQLRITQLQQEIKKYTIQPIKKRAEPDAFLNIKSQRLVKNLLAELISTHKTQVRFASIERRNNSVSFSGKARSAADLTEFLSQWKAAGLFAQINIQSIEQKENSWIDFSFQAIQDIS